MNNNGNNEQEPEPKNLITEESIEIIRRVLYDAPIENDEDLAALGEIYTD